MLLLLQRSQQRPGENQKQTPIWFGITVQQQIPDKCCSYMHSEFALAAKHARGLKKLLVFTDGRLALF